jgi:hypothetical protein
MSDSISNAGPEPSAPHRAHAVGATAGQWPEKKPMWPDRRLVDLLGIEHPLVLAPMAGLGTVELAASVCAGGGLGSLGCVGLQPETVIQRVDKLRGLTSKPINMNFFCHSAARADPAREANWRDRLARPASCRGRSVSLAPARKVASANSTKPASCGEGRGLKPPGATGLPGASAFPKLPAIIGPSSGRASLDGQENNTGKPICYLRRDRRRRADQPPERHRPTIRES